MKVAVIGAGAAGLVALRHLSAKPDIFQTVAYEQTSRVGGTWVYTDKVGKDEDGSPIHSSMYRNLSTNLPKEVMGLPDFPFPENLSSFMKHPDVLKYLEDYAAEFDLYKHIQFNKVVESVKPIGSSEHGSITWEVGVRDPKKSTQSEVDTEYFDAVIVCNGHYSVPLIPSLPGLDIFQGTVMHSHDYRHPEVFQDKTIVILGAGASGIDVALDLVQCATKITLCHKKASLQTPWPEKVVEKEGIKEVTATGVILDTGEEVKTDVLLFCTGYHYSFPFLVGDCKLDIDDGRVTPLWKHVIHAKYPTLSVVGLVKTVAPFPVFNCQAQFVVASLSGAMPLPSTEQMLTDMQQEFEWRISQGLPPRYAHLYYIFVPWDFNDLADMGGFPRIPTAVTQLYKHVITKRASNLLSYKKSQYRLLGTEAFEEIDV